MNFQKNLYLSGDGSDNNFGGFLAYNELAFLRNDVLREIYVPLSGTSPTFGVTTILTGTTNTSIWYNYRNGMRYYCGHTLEEGLKKNQK